ncbi:metallophosphoesterase [Saliphagus sp. LR7]|uniref:metallophosphoesterase n=1 Tax=Saliphagus sp. LR7 TaxID=2282654 RepID=UPI000DF76BFE|nr:metallophosphoesterase [Saliphagus sp. LR7]
MTDPDGLSTVGRAVYVPDSETLVIADVHLGRDVASRVEAPLGGGRDAIDRLEALLEGTDLAEVVVAGDILHSFSRVPRGVERDLVAFLETIEDGGARPVVVSGNHDTMLSGVYDGEIHAEYRLADGETVVAHGHEVPELPAKRYVVGHDHPAIEIEGRKRPCFLYGPGSLDGADVLMLPAFTRLAPGSTINGMSGSDFQSPLVADAGGWHPGVGDGEGETLWFPPLAECRRLL